MLKTTTKGLSNATHHAENEYKQYRIELFKNVCILYPSKFSAKLRKSPEKTEGHYDTTKTTAVR